MRSTLVMILIAVFALFSGSLLAENGEISGKVYYDYSWDLSENADNANAFEMHRVYFTYKKKLADNLKFNMTTDVGREGNTGKFDAYLKYAYVDYKTNYGNVIIGLQSMNVFKIQEYNWGYRFIEKSAMDLNKWSSSADLGLGYKNKLAEKVTLWAVVSNGAGYKKIESDKYKKYSVNLNYGESKIAGKDGYNAGVVVAYEPYEFATDTTENQTLFGVYGGYSKSAFRVGAEFDMFKDSGLDQTMQIISAYGTYKLTDKTELLARVDLVDPNTDVDKDGHTYIIGGVNIKPAKGLYVAPNIRYVTYQADGMDNDVVLKLNFQIKF
ncbi:MAG: hypothetical protein Kow00108_02010 [Calditrichia bacterium]